MLVRTMTLCMQARHDGMCKSVLDGQQPCLLGVEPHDLLEYARNLSFEKSDPTH